jgi:hypothetical protein
MSGSGKDYKVGYRRPPKATQWKSGQSGNPSGRSSPRSIGVAEIIDKLLLTRVTVTANDVSKRITILDIILEQLWNKGISGDRQAMAVYIRIQELVPRETDKELEITFTDGN